jgi:putative acetyltransferase
MKIRKVSEQTLPKVIGLLKRTFSGSKSEVALIEKLHSNNREIDEWVSIHINKVIGYIAFTAAYDGNNVCGRHLTLLAVKPEYQNEGVESELLRFALRQDEIKSQPLFVLGNPAYYEPFGFVKCTNPISLMTTKKKPLLSLGSSFEHTFTVRYEKEFV